MNIIERCSQVFLPRNKICVCVAIAFLSLIVYGLLFSAGVVMEKYIVVLFSEYACPPGNIDYTIFLACPVVGILGTTVVVVAGSYMVLLYWLCCCTVQACGDIFRSKTEPRSDQYSSV